MFRLPQNGRSRYTESSNISGEKFSLSSTATKTSEFWLRLTDHKFKAASWTFLKKNGNVQHYFEDELDFWNDR